MTRLLVFLLVSASCVAIVDAQTAPAPVAQPPKVDEVPKPNLLKLPNRKEAMAMKLKGAQSILEGIALNDFDKIAAAADDIVIVSNATDFLNAYRGSEYNFHVMMFRRPAETISKKAKEKNIDGVMVAYNDMTLSCLKCHQSMRDKKFEINVPNESGTVAGVDTRPLLEVRKK